MMRSEDVSVTRHKHRNFTFSIMTLAFWRIRHTWHVLLLMGIGVVAALVLVCAVPLYSYIVMSAGLRSALATSDQGGDIVVESFSQQISLPIMSKATQLLNADAFKKLGSSLLKPQYSLQTIAYPLSENITGSSQMQLVGASMSDAETHLHVRTGRLPQTSSDGIEVALLQETADLLHIHVGSTLTITISMFRPITGPNQVPAHYEQSVPLRVVGIFDLARSQDSFWHGITFHSVSLKTTAYTGLVSNDTLLNWLARDLATPRLAGYKLESPVVSFWYYTLDLSQLDINDLDPTLASTQSLQLDVQNNPTLNNPPYLIQTTGLLPTDLLANYHDRVSVVQLPVTGLLIILFALALYFLSLMAHVLVERQAEIIAVVASRGASQFQIIGALLAQSLGLGILALLVGPLLALPLAFFLARHILSSVDQGALALVFVNPLRTALSLAAYALVGALVVFLVMALSLRRAVQVNVLTLRRNASRTTRRPWWQRIRLDLLVMVILLTVYAILTYITRSDLLSIRQRLLLLSPLTFVGTMCLVAVCLLLFIRLFRMLLRLGAKAAMRGRGASPMLALAQMARAPDQSVRMMLLLALATSLVIFVLVYSTSQTQHIPDVASFEVGADFSGIPGDSGLTSAALKDETASYLAVPGVASATPGFKGLATGGANAQSTLLAIMAVDTDTFAHTALWTQQDSSQPLDSLMSLLTAGRSTALAGHPVPAIVDAAGWDSLHLSRGAMFTMWFSPYGLVTLRAVAEVEQVPTINDNVSGGEGNSDIPAGGVLVDYQSFASAYNALAVQWGTSLPINYVWVHAYGDPLSQANVRKVLNTGCCLELKTLYDRQAISETLRNDPLSLDIMGELSIGSALAVVLALSGGLIVSWVQVRKRLLHFAVLRSLGAAPRHIVGMLVYEQIIVYLLAIVLGIFCGGILSLQLLPAFVFTSATISGALGDISSNTFYAIQNQPPVRVLLPGSLALVLSLMIVVAAIALIIMIRAISQPSTSQVLRLNED